MKKVMLNEFTGREIRELLQSGQAITAIVSFGSCENHADHLPLGPDFFVPEAIACRVARRVTNTVVLPCTPFGTSIHYNA
ncbi:creatininase family protein, partial [Salmonella enterica subsp. enterica serovar Newport]|nr:creatininase family protein [Salmonella enterica subsp. enterica serovar Newport]